MMTSVRVGVKNLSQSLSLPKYAKEGDDGMDLMACFDGGSLPTKYSTTYPGGKQLTSAPEYGVTLFPGDRVLIPTGLKIQLPPGWRAQIYPRSGLALKEGITVLNTPGKIDSGYRGEIGVILINHGHHSITIYHGDRIAQISFERSEQASLELVAELDSTDRGEGGFGHSGV